MEEVVGRVHSLVHGGSLELQVFFCTRMVTLFSDGLPYLFIVDGKAGDLYTASDVTPTANTARNDDTFETLHVLVFTHLIHFIFRRQTSGHLDTKMTIIPQLHPPIFRPQLPALRQARVQWLNLSIRAWPQAGEKVKKRVVGRGGGRLVLTCFFFC